MKLTEEEEKTAAKNRQFMRHMTLSFWGFIIIAILSLFVWSKVQKWVDPAALAASEASKLEAKVQLLIHPEDQQFWTLSKEEMTPLIASWKQKNVTRVWVPISVQSVPFFKSKALKYALDEIPSSIEYDWYQKAVFPQLNELLLDEEIAIGGYYWYSYTKKTNSSFQNFASTNWFQSNNLFLNTASDSVTTYLKALADESIVSWNIDAFSVITNQETSYDKLEPEIELLSNALQRHKYNSFVQKMSPTGEGFNHTYMSINKWANMNKSQQNELSKLTDTFLVLGSDTTSVVLY